MLYLALERDMGLHGVLLVLCVHGRRRAIDTCIASDRSARQARFVLQAQHHMASFSMQRLTNLARYICMQ